LRTRNLHTQLAMGKTFAQHCCAPTVYTDFFKLFSILPPHCCSSLKRYSFPEFSRAHKAESRTVLDYSTVSTLEDSRKSTNVMYRTMLVGPPSQGGRGWWWWWYNNTFMTEVPTSAMIVMWSWKNKLRPAYSWVPTWRIIHPPSPGSVMLICYKVSQADGMKFITSGGTVTYWTLALPVLMMLFA